MSVWPRELASLALSLCLAACGSRSGLTEPSPDGAVDAGRSDAALGDAALVDAGRSDAALGDAGRSDAALSDGGPVESALAGVWWFGLASGALRFYAIAICPDGTTRLRASLDGDGQPDPENGWHEGVVFSEDPPRAVLHMEVPPGRRGFATMNVRYVEATDTLFWEEEAHWYAGWASGGGVRDRPAFVPADFLSCESQ